MAALISAGAFTAPFQWDMGGYFYTQFEATPASTYVTLLKALKGRIDDYLFATLNYELLLFQARAIAGIPTESLKVCLPHRNACICCAGISGQGIRFSPGVSTGGQVRVFQSTADFMAERHRNVFPPVMSYYEPNKFTVSGGTYIAGERFRFQQEILSAD